MGLFKHHRYLFIILLTLLYGFLIFTNLGSNAYPKTAFRPLKAPREVVMEIADEEKTFDRIFVTSLEDKAIGNDRYGLGYRDVKVAISDDRINWYEIAILASDDFGKWQVTSFDEDQKGAYLRLTFDDANTIINEIALYDSHTGTFRNLRLYDPSPFDEDALKLFDEQATLDPDFDYRNETYFDEIYHVRNAYEIVNELPLYTAVHPLLGTRMIALGIALFGMNPFGYRFFGALTTVALLPLFFLLVKELFQNVFLADIGALLWALDFMPVTTGRIATLEPFSLFGIILMYYWLLKFVHCDIGRHLYRTLAYLALCGLTMAVAWSIKWTAIYGSLGMAIIFLYKIICYWKTKDRYKTKKTFIIFLWCLIFFVIIPLAVYILAYQGILIYPEMPTSFAESAQQVFRYTLHAFNYHAGLVSTHPYASKWWMWLLDIRPIFYYVKYVGDAIISISCFNNPVIAIGGFMALIGLFFRSFKRFDEKRLIIIVAYLSCLLPWVFITRTSYAYHYYTCLPFLIMALLAFFQNKKRTLGVLVGLAMLVFGLYLPVIHGIPVTLNYVKMLEILPTWWFG